MQGKKVTCKKAEARQGKIYVGKLPAGEAFSKEDLKSHFQQFGSVIEVVRPVDKMKNNEPKTFAFITFQREDAAKALVKQVSHNTRLAQLCKCLLGGPSFCLKSCCEYVEDILS